MGALGTEPCMICQSSLTPTFTFFGRATLAFPPRLCRRRRQFLQGTRSLRSIRKELVGEDGHSMTGTCCDAVNST